MNIYFIKNLKTKRYIGDEHEPYINRSYWTDYEDARECAWARNVIYHKKLDSLDKYVVEVKQMNCPVMYVKYDSECTTRFFSVREAIAFYENEDAYEIGYETEDGVEHPLDLSKDWMWNDVAVRCTYFDDSFWNARATGDFEQSPGKHFGLPSEYARDNIRKLIISTEDKPIEFKHTCWFEDTINDALKKSAKFYDDNNVELTVKENYKHLYYDFGGSYTAHHVSFWYPNGRLFGYASI